MKSIFHFFKKRKKLTFILIVIIMIMITMVIAPSLVNYINDRHIGAQDVSTIIGNINTWDQRSQKLFFYNIIISAPLYFLISFILIPTWINHFITKKYGTIDNIDHEKISIKQKRYISLLTVKGRSYLFLLLFSIDMILGALPHLYKFLGGLS